MYNLGKKKPEDAVRIQELLITDDGVMKVIEQAFGKGITTRTWDMINRLVK